MSIRRMAALPLAGLLLGVLSWSLARAGGVESADPAPAPGASQTAQGAGGSASDAASPAPGASSPRPSGHAVRGGRPAGSEILPSPASAPSRAAGLPGLPGQRATSSAAPLVTRPLPRPASGTGRLAVGFPAVLAPPARDRIAVSSLTASHGVLQVSLTAACRRPCDPLRHYRVRLAARGFDEVAVASVENRPTAALERGTDSVTVSITSPNSDSGHELEYAVLAVLHAGG